MAETNQPAIREEELLALVRGYAPEADDTARDLLNGRYRLLLAQPLPEFDSPLAKAYAAQDDSAPGALLYALVHDPDVPLRTKHLTLLKGQRIPQMAMVMDSGKVTLSVPAETRIVTVLERPAGQTLHQLMANGRNPVSEVTLINLILRPLVEALVALAELGLSHNRINLNSIYLSSAGISFGECISSPSGFAQPPLFEPVDRMLTSPWAKPDIAIDADTYALCLVALHLILGYEPFADWTVEKLRETVLAKGSYHSFIVQWDLSDAMQDLFRGLLNDGRRDRWEPKVLASWLTGRHFNLILPSQPRDTPRPLEFMETSYFSRRALANALFAHWREARAFLFDARLQRWLETTAHKPETAEAVGRICGSAAPDNARSERANSDLLARILILLDPTGPIRLRDIHVSVEGLGPFVAYGVLRAPQDTLQILLHFLESELPAFWIDQHKVTDLSALGWKLQRARQFLRMVAPCFGIERCLYDLNLGLACQSPLIRRFLATSVKDVLLALDQVAADRGAGTDYLDRHVAAFLGSRLDINKEMRLTELAGLTELAVHPRLVALKLMAKAQAQAGNPPVKGLTLWAALRLLPLLDSLHKRGRRNEMQTRLKDVAQRGSFRALADLMLDSDLFAADQKGFDDAILHYAARRQAIAELNSNVLLARHARIAGRGIAQTVAYSICLATIYFTLRSHLHY